MSKSNFVVKSYKKMSFRGQLVLFFSISAIVSITLFSIVAYNQGISVLEQNFRIHTAAVLRRTKDELLTKLNNIENTLNFIATDQRLQNLHHPGYYISNRELTKFFVDCLALNDYQETREGRRFVKNLIDDLIFFSGQRVIISRGDHFTVYRFQDYLTGDLLARAEEAEGEIIWSGIFYNEVGARLRQLPEPLDREMLNQFAVVKYVTSERFKTGIGYLIASINLARLSNLVEEIVLGQSGRVYLIDRDLRVLAGRDKELILHPLPVNGEALAHLKIKDEGSFVGRFNDEKCFIHFEDIGLNNWKIVGVVAGREFQASAGLVRNRILTGGILILVLFVIIALVIANNLTRPIYNLCAFMQHVEAGNLEARAEETGSVEIERLSSQLNQMIKRLRELLNQVYQEQLFKRKAALKALQAQINPHFIYNTLESISWTIESGRQKVAGQLVEALASFFRLGLSGGREIVTLREELEHVRSYLQVQKIRYGDKLDYVFAVDEEIKEARMIKITLQPLVENAIYHGIKPKTDGPGLICISGEKSIGHLRLSIVDNGVGMSREKLAELQNLLARTDLDPETTGKGFSLQNINSRIKLYFGNEYGLSFYSKAGEGTRVELLLPFQRYPADGDLSEQG